MLIGHTRFATTSLSTLDGTHPHQWTPATNRRVYQLTQLTSWSSKDLKPVMKRVENFITHNGDFDFYQLNSHTYELSAVQKWLSIVTGTPMPAVVDSCAIAGMVGIIHSQGCFGLSARYAICLGLPTSTMDGTIVTSCSFPSYAHFEKIGEIFEKCLTKTISEFRKEQRVEETINISKTTASRNERMDFGNTVTKRMQLVSNVIREIRQHHAELFKPLKASLQLGTWRMLNKI